MVAFKYKIKAPIKITVKEIGFRGIRGNLVAAKALIPKAKPVNMKTSPSKEPAFSKKPFPGTSKLGRLQEKKASVKKENKKEKFFVMVFLVFR